MSSAGACLFGVAFLCYFLAGVLSLSGLFVKTPWSPVSRPVARIAFIAHSIALLVHGLDAGRAPFSNAAESLSFFAWCLLLLFLAVDWRTPQPGLGAFVFPLGFLALFLASARVNRQAALLPLVQDHALKIHIAVSLLGYSSFALAFCVALVYLVQERRLKQKRIGGLIPRLLPLEQADLLANRLVGVGFALLTLGLAMGFGYAVRDWRGLWMLDPKVVSSLVTWTLYGAYLYVRSIAGWRGRRTMLLLVAGFGALVVGFIGVNLSGLGRHAYPF